MGGVSPALQGLKDYDMTTLLHTHDGSVTTLADLKEQQVEPAPNRLLFWEEVQAKANTIGARDALNWALRQQNNTKP